MAYIVGTAADELLAGTVDDDTIEGLGGHDELNGGDGNDTLYGGDGNDFLFGMNGDDYLQGMDGDDIYYYDGVGFDIVFDYSGNDSIEMALGLDPSDISFIRYATSPDDLVIEVAGGDHIRLQQHFASWTSTQGIETLFFDDPGQPVFDLTTMQYTTYGSSGNDTIYGIVNNGSPDDIIYGFDGDDIIYGNNGNDYLDGGNGDDYLQGMDGDDIYYYDGQGNDIAFDYSGNDTVKLAAGIDVSDVTFIRYATDQDALFLLIDGMGSLKLDDHLSSFYLSNHFETLQFADNTTLDLTIGQYETHGSNGDDTIYGIVNNGSINDIIYGFDGNDTIYAGTGNDVVHGGNGDDFIQGLDDNDTIYGGDGLDTLRGDDGADTFVFEASSAFNDVDVVGDFNTGDGDALNIADLLIGFTPGTSVITDYVSLSVSGSDTTIAIDRDGTGGAYSAQDVVTLLNVTGLNVNDLYNNDHIIV